MNKYLDPRYASLDWLLSDTHGVIGRACTGKVMYRVHRSCVEPDEVHANVVRVIKSEGRDETWT